MFKSDEDNQGNSLYLSQIECILAEAKLAREEIENRVKERLIWNPMTKKERMDLLLQIDPSFFENNLKLITCKDCNEGPCV
jgi:hypothetical protein